MGSIAELWIYPVKSMRGVRVAQVGLDAEGLRGDRRFAFESSNAPAGKPLLSSRERAAMLLYQPAELQEELVVRTPEGDRLPLDSDPLLQSFSKASTARGAFQLRKSPAVPLTDVRPVSLVSTATLEALANELAMPVDPQRFRSNILLRLDASSAFAEDAWSGRVLRFGDGPGSAELLLRERIPRCRMVSLDPATAEPDHAILRQLARAHDGRLGVYGSVQRAGLLEERQPVFLL